MALHTFPSQLVVDKATGRGVAGAVGTVTDRFTGAPVDVLDSQGNPKRLLTNHDGYFEEFRTSDQHDVIVMTFGRVSLTGVALEIMQKASEAPAQLSALTAQYLQDVANQNTKITNLDARVEGVEALAGLSPATPVDGQTANLIEQPGTLTKAALSAAIDGQSGVKLGAEVVAGPLTFAALQSAANLAATNGRTLYAAGVVTTDQTLTIASDTEMGALTYNYTGNGVAVRVGSATTIVERRKGTLPRVIQSAIAGAGTWTDSKIGIQLINNDSCVWLIPHVKNFGVGLDEVGENKGHAYNTITLGHLENNKVNNRFRAVGTGWANQNTHIGGRLGHNSGEGSNTPGTRHIQLVAADVNAINNNTWVGTSLEATTAEFHADVAGTANMFINCRWESVGGARVRWGAGSVNNQILYGYQSAAIVQTFGSGATRNQIFASDRNILPVGAGTVTESTAGDAAPVESLMASGGIVAGANPATAYAVRRTANATHMKRPADAFDRVRIDHVNGRIYFGNGLAEPTTYVGVAGTALRLEVPTSTTSPAAGSAGALPATPAGYMEIFVGGNIRKLPYY